MRSLKNDRNDGRSDISEDRFSLLVATNERLVLAAMEAQIAADTATSIVGALTRASQRDALTDTLNRVLMLDRLESAIGIAQRRGTQVAWFLWTSIISNKLTTTGVLRRVARFYNCSPNARSLRCGAEF